MSQKLGNGVKYYSWFNASLIYKNRLKLVEGLRHDNARWQTFLMLMTCGLPATLNSTAVFFSFAKEYFPVSLALFDNREIQYGNEQKV